jgi:hypothetical protein
VPGCTHCSPNPAARSSKTTYARKGDSWTGTRSINNFQTLDLKRIEALPLDLPTPRVFATEGTIGSNQAWEDLRDYDVVVATLALTD